MTKGEEYLKMYPSLMKWINQCIACQSIGYKPDLPHELATYDGINMSAAAANLRRFFKPMSVDEIGLCDTCKKFR
ncbi:hypothetical protein B1748_29030 [Paenibacillus sp. MY03]|nr:hypothetical protein B1748_29030 [Paenibacillus sp. MY03]